MPEHRLSIEELQNEEKRCVFLSRLLGFSRDRISKLCSAFYITRTATQDCEQIFLMNAEMALRRYHTGHRIGVATWCINRGIGAVKDWIRQETRVRVNSKLDISYIEDSQEAMRMSTPPIDEHVLSWIEMDEMTKALPKTQRILARHYAFEEPLGKYDITKCVFQSREYFAMANIVTVTKSTLRKKLRHMTEVA